MKSMLLLVKHPSELKILELEQVKGKYEVSIVACTRGQDRYYRKKGYITYTREQFLSNEIPLKFDFIIGNPPFQESKSNGERKDQASNLWSKFWSRAITTAKDDATVALITPTSWVSPSADLKGSYKINGQNRLWDVFNQYTSTANVTSVAKHFEGVGSSFGYVIVDKSGSDGLTFTHNVPTTLGFLPLSGYERVFEELALVDNLGDHFEVNQCNTPDLRVSIPLTRALDSDDKVEILEGVSAPSAGSDKDGLYLYVHVSTRDEADKVRRRIIDCFDILRTHCRFSGFMNIQTFKMIKYSS